MARKRVGPNVPCPCGSGKKYKHCCRKKGLEYFEDDDGNVSKSVPITPEMGEVLMEQRQKFIDKFGREPGPNDLVFFDMPPTEHIEHQTVEAMKRAGIDPAIIFAYEKTGRLVTEDNQHLLSDVDLDEWEAAIEEYEFRHSGKKPEFPIGTVAMYGPNDKITTKFAAAVIMHENAEPIMRRWVASDITTNPKIQREMEEFFTSHGVNYLVHIPPKYDSKKPTPVVLAFHGGGGNADSMIVFSGLNKKADAACFIVVYPSGTGTGPFLTWNAGGFKGRMAEGRADDVAFIGKLLDDLGTVVKVDEKRVYPAA